ncbi:hypothetical protein [Amycolatopsis sp. NPDC004079]|uniref:hypothetical protein n=1 Tax=Amycolatopsis sp. NPDC004079 TaxID=3154549 RepID=UPI0033A2A5DF
MATPAISMRLDERPSERRTFVRLHGVDELVDLILSPPPHDAPACVRGHREIHLGDRPFDPLHPEMAPMMLVAIGGPGGAVYFRDLDGDGRAVGFVAHGDGRAVAPRLPFGAQGGIEFEPQDVMSRGRLERVVRACLLCGKRSEVVAWRDSAWVQ